MSPAGYNPECFRIYEAVEAGSIPVLVLDDAYHKHPCGESFTPLVDSGAPFVFLKKWDELATALQGLLAAPVELERRQREMMEWRDHFWKQVATPTGLERQYESPNI